MAYKDEYEVARLHLKQAWKDQLDTMFASPHRAYYHLHPPLLRSMGLKRKLKLGPWFSRPLRQLRRLKSLRGRWCDPFGYAKLRREERRLITWYRETITSLLSRLDPGNHALAVVIANAPEAVRGYEDIKLQRLAETKELVAQHLSRFAQTPDAEAVGSPPAL
jgi:indolepyruvate ferredoxin oxidoreductase